MHDMTVHVLRPGEYVATDTGSELTFYQVQLDGSIEPSATFTDTDAEALRAGLDTEGNPVTRETPLEKLHPQLSVRTFNVLMREGVKTVGEVLDTEPGSFHDMRNMGGKGWDEIAARRREWQRAGLS